ncbi:MAG: hypothetical protein ABIF19_00900 [Planctomycetota bacterium]
MIQRDNGEREMAFEGTVGYNSLEGVFRSDSGEAPTEGTLVGASLAGTWNLDIDVLSKKRTFMGLPEYFPAGFLYVLILKSVLRP